MRLRARSLGTGQTAKLELPESSSLQELQTNIAGALPELDGVSPSCLTLSLNKKDPLLGSASAALRSLGIASGDLLWVTHAEKGQHSSSSLMTAPHSSQSDLHSEAGQDPASALPVVPQASAAPDVPANSVPELAASKAATGPTAEHADVPEAESREPMHVDSSAADEDSPWRLQPDYLSRVAQASAAPSSLAEALVLLIHAAFLEGGLKLDDQDGASLPPGWHLGAGFSTLRYRLAGAAPQASGGTCSAGFTLLGTYLIVTASGGTGAVSQLMLSVPEHADWSGAEGSACVQYCRQDETWAQAKDSLVLPVKARLCKAAGRALPLSLLLLPSELRDRCLQQLQPSDLAKVSCVCLELRQAASANHLWQPHLQQLSPSHARAPPGGSSAAPSYKSIFGRLLARQQREQAARRRAHQRFQPSLNPFLGARPGLVQPPPPGYMPGIVGGEYDRLPFLPGMGSGGLAGGTFGGLGSGGLAPGGLFGTGRLRGSGSWRLH